MVKDAKVSADVGDNAGSVGSSREAKDADLIAGQPISRDEVVSDLDLGVDAIASCTYEHSALDLVKVKSLALDHVFGCVHKFLSHGEVDAENSQLGCH